ncbi:MAG: DUF2809 domain-containing protein [Oscillospiraceae bacterium]|jgi:hypothetical protein|nr:DUF2809 domain-containing protein [Oscillospiraceae bacterium]
MTADRKKRLFYAGAALVLFAAEVCIALAAHDGFVRPYLGDALAVILLHCAVRILWPENPRRLPLYVFLLACAIEAAQAIHLLRFLGLEGVGWLTFLLGSSFSWGDVLCYFAGCAFVAAGECVYAVRRARNDPRQG